MLVTPTALVLVLQTMGYPVTLRCLTDWRAKGLLPALTVKGRGKGKGVARYWTETDIVRRAVEVFRRLRKLRRARRVLISLCGQGYKCEASSVRKAFVAMFDRAASYNKRSITRFAPQIAKDIPRTSTHIGHVLVEVFKILSDRNWKCGDEIDFEMVVDFINQIARQASQKGRLLWVEGDTVYEFFKHIRLSFSPVGFRRAVEAASDAELLDAQASWAGFWEMLNGLNQTIAPQPDGRSSCMELAAALAPIGIPMLLPLRIS